MTIYLKLSNDASETPAYSVTVVSVKRSTRRKQLKIEVNMEVPDIGDRSHRCLFYVKSDLGALEKLGQHLLNLSSLGIGNSAAMYDIG